MRNRFENHNIFGEIVDEKMMVNEWGEIVLRQWVWLSKQYHHVRLDDFVIMPDHFHGIIGITAFPAPGGMQKIKPLDQLIGAFKTTSSKMIHQGGSPDFRWQFNEKLYHYGRRITDHSIQFDRDDFPTPPKPGAARITNIDVVRYMFSGFN